MGTLRVSIQKEIVTNKRAHCRDRIIKPSRYVHTVVSHGLLLSRTLGEYDFLTDAIRALCRAYVKGQDIEVWVSKCRQYLPLNKVLSMDTIYKNSRR